MLFELAFNSLTDDVISLFYKRNPQGETVSYKDNITVIFTALSLFLGDLKLDTFFKFLLANFFSKQKH